MAGSGERLRRWRPLTWWDKALACPQPPSAAVSGVPKHAAQGGRVLQTKRGPLSSGLPNQAAGSEAAEGGGGGGGGGHAPAAGYAACPPGPHAGLGWEKRGGLELPGRCLVWKLILSIWGLWESPCPLRWRVHA